MACTTRRESSPVPLSKFTGLPPSLSKTKCSLIRTAHLLAGIIAFTATTNSYADIEFNGFISTIGSYATEREVHGYEYKEVTLSPDSRFGLQISTNLSHRLSATGQMVARSEEQFSTELAWAYISYQAGRDTQFRMGRFRAPFFLYSDHQEVGYSYPWISPPLEVYALQFDSVEGFDLIHQIPLGPANLQIQAYAGSLDDRFALSKTDFEFKTRLRDQLGVVGTFNYDWLTLRTSFHQVSRLTLTNLGELPLPAPLGNVYGLQQAVENLNNELGGHSGVEYVLRNLMVEDVATEFAQAALRTDWRHFFFVAEGTLLTFRDGPLARQRRHFASIGTRFGDTTLYFNYSRANDLPAKLHQNIPLLGGATAGIRAALAGYTESLSLESTTYALGLRQDFYPGAAFKLEIAENEIPDNDQSNLIRFGFDLVF